MSALSEAVLHMTMYDVMVVPPNADQTMNWFCNHAKQERSWPSSRDVADRQIVLSLKASGVAGLVANNCDFGPQLAHALDKTKNFPPESTEWRLAFSATAGLMALLVSQVAFKFLEDEDLDYFTETLLVQLSEKAQAAGCEAGSVYSMLEKHIELTDGENEDTIRTLEKRANFVGELVDMKNNLLFVAAFSNMVLASINRWKLGELAE
jgi:hypothetical protein